MINDTDSFSIKYLSGRDLQLYFKEGPTSTGGYTEEWDNYKK
jgi:hypothetical protein